MLAPPNKQFEPTGSVVTCAQQARHCIMRLLRAGHLVARRLNCGVRPQTTTRTLPNELIVSHQFQWPV